MAAPRAGIIAGIALAVALVVGGAAAGPVQAAQQCAQWEKDAQALAEALQGDTGEQAGVLRDVLAENGFVAGSGASAQQAPDAGSGLSDLLAKLVAAIMGGLDTDGDGEVGVVVLGDAPAAGQCPATR